MQMASGSGASGGSGTAQSPIRKDKDFTKLSKTPPRAFKANPRSNSVLTGRETINPTTQEPSGQFQIGFACGMRVRGDRKNLVHDAWATSSLREPLS